MICITIVTMIIMTMIGNSDFTILSNDALVLFSLQELFQQLLKKIAKSKLEYLLIYSSILIPLRINISCNFIDYRSIITICIKGANSSLYSFLLYCRSRNQRPSKSNNFYVSGLSTFYSAIFSPYKFFIKKQSYNNSWSIYKNVYSSLHNYPYQICYNKLKCHLFIILFPAILHCEEFQPTPRIHHSLHQRLSTLLDNID